MGDSGRDARLTSREREFFPVYQPPGVRVEELHFIPLRELKGAAFLRPWFRKWSDEALMSDNVADLWSRLPCPALKSFAVGLFEKAQPVGVLVSDRQARAEATTQWLVLESRERPHKSLSVTGIVESHVGEFFFLKEPCDGLPLNQLLARLREDGIPADLVTRFFLVFGGLRDSAPFFGGDFFYDWPEGGVDESIECRVHESDQDWIESEYIHARGNVDYLLLRNRTEVGFMPIEPEQRVTLYAPSFAEAIMKWLDEPRPFDYRSSEPWQFTKWQIEDDDCLEEEDDNAFES